MSSAVMAAVLENLINYSAVFVDVEHKEDDGVESVKTEVRVLSRSLGPGHRFCLISSV